MDSVCETIPKFCDIRRTRSKKNLSTPNAPTRPLSKNIQALEQHSRSTSTACSSTNNQFHCVTSPSQEHTSLVQQPWSSQISSGHRETKNLLLSVGRTMHPLWDTLDADHAAGIPPPDGASHGSERLIRGFPAWMAVRRGQNGCSEAWRL